jgi:hypothetical protein
MLSIPIPSILFNFIVIPSMISVYGQRATMVSFSAFSNLVGFAHLQTGWDRIQYSGLILLGGLFYLIVSLIFFYIRPNRYAELQIAECIN